MICTGKNNKNLTRVFIGLVMLLWLAMLGNALAATRVINSNGGQCAFDGANGGSTVYAAENSQFQVERCLQMA